MGKGGKQKKASKKEVPSVKQNPLFQKTPRSFRVGGDIMPKRDMTRFVRWPRYILLQRQKRILLQRVKVPPQINQFSKTLDHNQASGLLKFLSKYRVESKQLKKERLLKKAQQKSEQAPTQNEKKHLYLKYGLNHVTHLVEEKLAKLVVIAHDVDPIELVICLPELCRKQGVPFCFVKCKARLGQLVGKKTATCVALTEVRKEDHQDLELYCKNFRSAFNDNNDLRKVWGGGLVGIKSTHRRELQQKAIEQEFIQKNK